MIRPDDKMPIEIKDGYLVVFQDLDDNKLIYTIAFTDKYKNIYCANNENWFDLGEYQNEIMCSRFFKIIKVYGKRSVGGAISFSTLYRDLIYDAVPKKKMTKSDIEKILGYEIEIVD